MYENLDEYARKLTMEYMENFFENDGSLCRISRFTLEEIPTLIEKVTKSGNTEVAAMLLEYRETKFSEKEKEAFAKKQFKL